MFFLIKKSKNTPSCSFDLKTLFKVLTNACAVPNARSLTPLGWCVSEPRKSARAFMCLHVLMSARSTAVFEDWFLFCSFHSLLKWSNNAEVVLCFQNEFLRTKWKLAISVKVGTDRSFRFARTFNWICKRYENSKKTSWTVAQIHNASSIY